MFTDPGTDLSMGSPSISSVSVSVRRKMAASSSYSVSDGIISGNSSSSSSRRADPVIRQLSTDIEKNLNLTAEEQISILSSVTLGDSKPVMLLMKRSTGAKHTRNSEDLVRQWSENFTERLMSALRSQFPEYDLRLFSDKDEKLMTSHGSQIKVFAEADVLVGMHGAGLSNQVYMKPNSAVVGETDLLLIYVINLTSYHLASSHLISTDLISSHLISSELISPDLILLNLISSKLIRSHLT